MLEGPANRLPVTCTCQRLPLALGQSAGEADLPTQAGCTGAVPDTKARRLGLGLSLFQLPGEVKALSGMIAGCAFKHTVPSWTGKLGRARPKKQMRDWRELVPGSSTIQTRGLICLC